MLPCSGGSSVLYVGSRMKDAKDAGMHAWLIPPLRNSMRLHTYDVHQHNTDDDGIYEHKTFSSIPHVLSLGPAYHNFSIRHTDYRHGYCEVSLYFSDFDPVRL